MKKKTKMLIIDMIVAFALFVGALFGASSLFKVKNASADIVTIEHPNGTSYMYNDEYFKILPNIDVSTDDDNLYTLTYYIFSVKKNTDIWDSNTTVDFGLYNDKNELLQNFKVSPYMNKIEQGTITPNGDSASCSYYIFPVTVTLAPELVYEKVQLWAVSNIVDITKLCIYANKSEPTSLYEKWSTIDDLQAYGFSINASNTIDTYIRSEQTGFKEKVNSVAFEDYIDNGASLGYANYDNFIVSAVNYNKVSSGWLFYITLQNDTATKSMNIYFMSDGIFYYETNDFTISGELWQDICKSINIYIYKPLADYETVYYYVYIRKTPAIESLISDRINYSVNARNNIYFLSLPATDDYTNELEQSNEALRAEILELYERIDELTESLTAKETEMRTLNNEIARLLEQITVKETLIKNLTAEKEELEKDLNASEEELVAKQETIDAYRENVAELTAQAEELQKRYDALYNDANADQQGLIDLYNEQLALAKKYAKENVELKSENENLKTELEELKAKNQVKISAGCNGAIGQNTAWVSLVIFLLILPEAVIMRFFKKNKKEKD